MIKIIKRNRKGKKVIIEEKPELKNLDLTSDNIKNQIGDSSDVVTRDLLINGKKELPVHFFCIDGLVNTKNVDDDILKPLQQDSNLKEADSEKDAVEKIMNGSVYHNQIKLVESIDKAIEGVLSGGAILVFDHEKKAVLFDIKGFDKRSISPPEDENVIKGSKDSFIEAIRTNTALIRRKIRSQNLRIIESKIGWQTYTSVGVVYIEGLTNEHLVKEVQDRLDKIKVDRILMAGDIEEYIIDNKLSMFPQVIYTERPDKLAQHLVDGRVGIIIDGLPQVYIVPATFDVFFQAPEDYANNYLVASFLRIMRYAAYFITLLLPGFYIAILSFHQELIPTELAVSIIKSKQGVPFPVFIEVVGLLLSFELLMEAGIRLPRNIGQAVSILGAIVVGQAAVQAKLVSPGVVIVVALTGIAGFTMPSQDFANSVRIWRLIIAVFSAIGGLFGLIMSELFLGYLLAKMEVFGIPYYAPFASTEGKDVKEDTIVRLPLWTMKKRPLILRTINKKRQKGEP